MVSRAKHLDVSVTPTIGTDAYTANDVVGGLLTFALPSITVAGGLINRVLLTDDDNEQAALTLYLFNAEPSAIADDAAFAPTISDLQKLVAVVDLSTYVAVNSNAYSLVEDINNSFQGNKNALYGYLVCTGTPTYTAATDLTVIVSVISEQ